MILILCAQMLTGRTPFIAENDYLTFQVVCTQRQPYFHLAEGLAYHLLLSRSSSTRQTQIINHSNDDFEFPESVPEVAQDLIRKLLLQVRRPTHLVGKA